MLRTWLFSKKNFQAKMELKCTDKTFWLSLTLVLLVTLCLFLCRYGRYFMLNSFILSFEIENLGIKTQVQVNFNNLLNYSSLAKINIIKFYDII